MPTLQDLLASRQPDKLQELLDSIRSGKQASAIPSPAPTPPQPEQPTPLSEEELASLSGPNSSPYIKPEQPKGIGPFSDAAKYAQTLPQKEETPKESEEEIADSSDTIPDVSNQSRIDRLLASPDTVGTLENLRAAQQRAIDNRASADIMAQGAKFGANLAGAISKLGPSKADTELADKLRSEADLPAKQMGEQLEMEKDDPSSAYSKNFREFAKPLAAKAGITLPENMSARQIGTLIPQLEKMYDAKIRQDTNTLKAKELQASKDANLELRKKVITDRLENQVNNRFDKNTKDEVGRIQSADRVMSIINAVKNGALIDSNTIRNTITNDVSILAMPIGSRGTLSDREKTAINTLSTKLKDAEVFLSDNPTKTIPPKMLAQLESEINLLKDKYVKALEQKTKSLKAGTNDETAKELFDARAGEFINQSEHKDDMGAEQEVISAPNGKKYLVDHKTKKVIKEVK